MFLIIFFGILYLPYLMCKLLVRRARAKEAASLVGTQTAGSISFGTEPSIQCGWSALDDLQLIRLLADSAPRTNEE